MKKRYFFVIISFILCMLGACGISKYAKFSGSKTGDENHYDICFDILNTTYSHTFDMKQGESLLVHVEKESGEIIILIRGGQEEPVYEGNGNIANDFTVVIPETGTYTVSVHGKEAKGHVTFERKQAETKKTGSTENTEERKETQGTDTWTDTKGVEWNEEVSEETDWKERLEQELMVDTEFFRNIMRNVKMVPIGFM